MVSDGAAIIDVGGESTRPGAQAVNEQQELDRVIPVIEAIHREVEVTISVDTSKPAVMREAVNAGAGFINDVRALREEGALACAAELDVPVCLMHMQGEPRTMQKSPVYTDVIDDIKAFLKKQAQLSLDAGIKKDMIYVDPGIGFGKTLEQNLSILKHLSEFRGVGCKILIGVSRKSMIGAILDEPVDRRVYGSIALASAAVMSGVSIIRAHDVKATCDAITVTESVMHAK
jgi:dihydropteroate synthase